MKIMYMGTPDFAVPPLAALLAVGHEICCAVTRPDMPKGRGQKLQPTPVKTFAETRGIPVCQPETLKDMALLPVLAQYAPEAVVLAAYGKILPKYVLDFPRFGCINIHASLLPKYRGAAPVQRALINGETETGVTIMQMAEGVDTGDIWSQESVTIGESENAGELLERLSILGGDLLVKTLPSIESGSLTSVKQDDALATHAPPLDKGLSRMDFTQTALAVFNLVRGLSPKPGVEAELAGHRVKLTEVRPSSAGYAAAPPGSVIRADTALTVACGGGTTLDIIMLQPEGGRPMDAAAYLRGHPLG